MQVRAAGQADEPTPSIDEAIEIIRNDPTMRACNWITGRDAIEVLRLSRGDQKGSNGEEDMTTEPKPRKTNSKTHKCFGVHSRILTQEMIDQDSNLKASGRTAGGKQIDPSAYGKQGRSGRNGTERRTRAELRNADERRNHQIS